MISIKASGSRSVRSVKSVKLHSVARPRFSRPPARAGSEGGAEGNNGISLTLLTTLTAKPDQPDFQQAKKPSEETSVFTNCGKHDRTTREQSKAKSEPKLTRVAFRVSRTKRKLQNQTGQSAHDWSRVVLKELTDNAVSIDTDTIRYVCAHVLVHSSRFAQACCASSRLITLSDICVRRRA